MAFICSLAIPLYFLRLMADGRKLQEEMADRRPVPAGRAHEREAKLITSDYALWTAHPFDGAERAPAEGDRAAN